jgi:hypothetical protein
MNENWNGIEADLFQISSSLLPILHPRLVYLNLDQDFSKGPVTRDTDVIHEWDVASLFHLGLAATEMEARSPRPTILF